MGQENHFIIRTAAAHKWERSSSCCTNSVTPSFSLIEPKFVETLRCVFLGDCYSYSTFLLKRQTSVHNRFCFGAWP